MSAGVVAWHRVLLPDIIRDHPRVAPSVLTVARTLCDLAARHRTQKVWAGAYYVAEHSGAHNGGRELHPRTVQRALVLLRKWGKLELVQQGGRGRTPIAELRRGGRGIASIYTLPKDLLGRLRKVAHRGNPRLHQAISQNYGESAVAGDIYISLPVTKEKEPPPRRASRSRPQASARPWGAYLASAMADEDPGGGGVTVELRGSPASWASARPLNPRRGRAADNSEGDQR